MYRSLTNHFLFIILPKFSNYMACISVSECEYTEEGEDSAGSNCCV